jgi:hypothetical protein
MNRHMALLTEGGRGPCNGSINIALLAEGMQAALFRFILLIRSRT